MNRQYRLEIDVMDMVGIYDTFDAALRAAGNGEFISTWEAPEGSEDWDEIDRIEVRR